MAEKSKTETETETTGQTEATGSEETLDRSLLTDNYETGAGTEAEAGEAKQEAEASAEQTQEVPKKYELTMPEGWSLDEQGLSELTPIMQKLKASNEQVQAVADIYVRRMAAAREAQLSEDRKTINAWQKEITEDPEIGGVALKENLALVSKVLRKYADDDFVMFLDKSNLGNYPPFVKAMIKMSKDLSSDRIIPGGRGASGGGDPMKEAADLIFGNLE